MTPLKPACPLHWNMGMAARAIWKGEIHFGTLKVPVKLYSAVTDRKVHFRLLHKTDKQPVEQKMVDAETGNVVEGESIRKAYPVTRSALVVLADEELEELNPKPSREIGVTRFVDADDLDPRWYDRAYYLGPDNSTQAYFALADALAHKKKEGIARWTMRNKEYIGALRNEDGYLMLITLRHADEVIDASHLQAPEGRALDAREVAMAEQLIDALTGKFDPHEFRDEYRQRVIEMAEEKARGGKVKVTKFRPRPSGDASLQKALAASLAGVGKKAASGGRR